MPESRPMDLSFATSDELISELRGRYPFGALLMEKEGNGRVDGAGMERTLRLWGNSTWLLGATMVLHQEAQIHHDSIWRGLGDPPSGELDDE